MSNVAAGILRHRVRIEEQVTAKDSFGQVDTYWAPFATVWAAIEPLSAREFLAAQQVQSKASARITIRYRPGLLASMRIIHRDTLYNIEGILQDKESGIEYMTLPVSSGPYYREADPIYNLISESGDQLIAESGDVFVTE